MGRVERSRKSRRDSSEIWDYVAADNVAAADRVIRCFDQQAQALADLSGFDRPSPYRPGLMSMPVKNYIIYYRRIEGRHRNCPGPPRRTGPAADH